jgi:hypothetical protein
MSDPGRLTSHDKTFRAGTRGLILRIVVVALFGMFFWQAILAAGMLWRLIDGTQLLGRRVRSLGMPYRQITGCFLRRSGRGLP